MIHAKASRFHASRVFLSLAVVIAAPLTLVAAEPATRPTTRPNIEAVPEPDRKLHKAISGADLDEVKRWLDGGANVNGLGIYGKCGPPLVHAVEVCWHIRHDNDASRNKRKLAIVKLLLDRGADPNSAYPGRPECSALVFAVAWDVTEAAEMLLDRGAKMEPSVLWRAAAGGYADMVQLLIAGGADVNATYGHGTPLGVARSAKHEDVVEILIKAGAKDAIPATNPAEPGDE